MPARPPVRQIQRQRQRHNKNLLMYTGMVHIDWYDLWLINPNDHLKTKTKTKNKVLKRPIICYIFEKQGVQEYQIWYSCIISASSVHHQCIITASSMHQQCISASVQQGNKADATRIKMQQGSRYNKDKDATSINMERGSRYNEDQDATRIFSAPSPPSVLHFDLADLILALVF